jgi:iron complex outermembrane receptor protein
MVVASIALVLFAIPGFAEEPKEYTLDTVVVSAQKREENVQDVPLSVGVVGGITLEENRITEFSELNSIMPNLYISSVGGAGTFSQVGIRGRINGENDIDPTVTVLVDGVPYDDFYAMGANLLFDVERVEVLRGPQSTMYGLNSEAGVINIVTRQPGNTRRIELYGEGGGGEEWGGFYTVGGSLSGAIVQDVLTGGIALMSKGQGGYIKNDYNGSKYNNDNNAGARGNLVWTPTPDLTVSGGLTYTSFHGGYGYIDLPFDDEAERRLGQDYGHWETDIDWEGGSNVRTWAPHLNINYTLGDVQLTSVSAYRKSEQEYDLDYDLTPQPIMFGYTDNDFRTFTQELRAQSVDDGNSPLQWLFGYFYHDFERAQVFGFGNPAYPDKRSPFMDASLNGHSHALFGQGTYRFLDRKLGVTVGGRQEWTWREAESHSGYFDTTSMNDSQFLPKFALDYRLTPDDMVYGSVTQGWRSGGVNHLVTNSDHLEFDKETCWAYEVGVKTSWLDNRVQFNAAVFYTDYTDYQDRVQEAKLISYLANVPEVRMYGFETELEAMLTEKLRLDGSFGYVNARYKEFPDAIHGNFNENTVAMVPDFDARLALKYSFLENYYVRPELQGVGTIYWNRQNSKKQDPYMVLNLRAGYMGNNYEVYVFGENLANTYAFQYTTELFGDGNLYGNPITPFRIGLGVRFEF